MQKIDYPHVKNYIVKFSWNDKANLLMLGYDVGNLFRFIDLEAGQIYGLSFESIDEAEKWLSTMSEILEENAICQTYVP